ncbi:hypothetical protein [Geobacter anodireducens]|uniref:Cytochrome C n=1 Tax=Geobacter soli TaxID=1510391 RepID=A0A0C1TX55_9BACT|nr:hypothetical protein [Geobacter soli]KIE43948.1 hypothetical protein SE37_15615 [Geobacter soli]
MKRTFTYGIVAALGIMVGGVAYAATCTSCGDDAKCKNPQAVQQFKENTAPLRKSLNEKEIALRAEYGMNSIDSNRTTDLENQIGELKEKIRSAGEQMGFAPCCLS